MPEKTKMLPMGAETLEKFWSEIEDGLRARKRWEPWWDANLDQYAPSSDKDPKAYGAIINTNRDYALVEQKKAQLFFQSPEVSAKAAKLMAGAEDAVAIHQDVLNEYLGPDEADVSETIDAALFDLLCPAGIGVTKMGYENVVEEIDMPMPVPDPTTGQPAVDPMTGQPMMVPTKVPVPIWERLFWERVSPKSFILPASLKGSDYDKAPWLALEFSIGKEEIRKRYGVTPGDDVPTGAADDANQTLARHAEDGKDKGQYRGVELWYRAYLYDAKVKHPERLRVAVLIKGMEKPLVHRDSPYQTVDPKTGGLTPDSLVGFPIHPVVTRNQSDEAWLPSDCTISRPQVNELNRFREQQIKMRDSNIPLRMVNADVVPKEAFEASIAQTEIGDFLFLPGDVFAGENIREIAKATYPRENLAFEEKQDADIARTHGMDANQAGVTTEEKRTATELQLVQSNTNVRLDKERAKVLKWYVKGVTKFSTLVQRFVTVERAAAIVGPQAAQRWAQVMKQAPARLAFTARPDSTIRVDAAYERKTAIDEYSMLRRDPLINPTYLIGNLARRTNSDPAQLINKEPPKQEPEPPKVQVVVKGEDFAGPQAPIMVELLRQGGINISPQALQASQMLSAVVAAQAAQQMQAKAQSQHGGPTEQAETVAGPGRGATGGMQGTGAPAPMAPGGQGMRNATGV